jgi:hypothetical protein
MANPVERVRPGRWHKVLAAAVLALCSLVYMVRGYQDQRITLQSLDFKTVYGGARCLLHGCDPYDSQQIFAEYAKAGGPVDDTRPFRPHEAIYFPSALSLLTPFALLPWEPAHLLWLAVSTGVFVLGTALIADLCFEFAPVFSAGYLGFFLLTSTTLIMLAQPTQLTIGLCAVATWCLLRKRFVGLGIVCFALSLTLKPHVTGLVWLYFLLRDASSRRRAWHIAILTAVLYLPGVVWASMMPASSHWLSEIPSNVRGITAHGQVGDPGPANPEASAIGGLQPLFSLFRDDPGFYNKAAEAVGVVLLAAWLVPVVRMHRSVERDFMALAAVVCISLLPVYHREYDTRMLLLTFPAFALLMARGQLTRTLTAGITLSTLTFITHNWNNYVITHVLAQDARLTAWQTIAWLRPVPVFTLLLTLYYLAWLYADWLGQRPHAPVVLNAVQSDAEPRVAV